MAGHIGIVACSAEGAALCYTTICAEGAQMMGRFAHPEITLHTFPFNEYMNYIEAGEWEGAAGLMLAWALKVASAGAEFIVCPDNTIHQAFDLVIGKSPVPWIHIAGEVASEAKHRGYRRIGLMGTRFLMEGPVYVDKLAAVNIECCIPNIDDRKRINDIIFDELIGGIFLSESRSFFQSVIQRFEKDNCDAVILGCTEIPLLITEKDSPLPLLDSTRLLARAALRRAK